MGEINSIKPNDNEQISLEHNQDDVEDASNSPNWQVTKTDLACEKVKTGGINGMDSQSANQGETTLTFAENVQRAVEEISNWPKWKVNNMRLAFSEQRGWKVNGKDNQSANQGETILTFAENVQRAVEEVSNWPEWKVNNMRLAFSEQRGWKVKGQKI